MADAVRAPGAAEARELLRSGAATRVDLLDASMRRIESREPILHAWEHLDEGGARAQAGEADRVRVDASRRRAAVPLDGICVGIKDVIDAVGLPTEHGSPIYRGRRPRADAACVRALRDAGAILVGKTVTTELAFVDPAKTINPLAADRTPGASSCGSAVVVADGMVAVAIGTQSSASVIRPAAYCGVLGFKPTIGTISTAGIKQSSPALDSVGIFARDVADLALAFDAFSPVDARPPDRLDRSPRIGLVRTAQTSSAEFSARAVLEQAAETLAGAGARIDEVRAGAALDALPAAQERLASYDFARALSFERAHAPELLGPAVRDAIEAGMRITPGERADALDLRDRAGVSLPELFGRRDALLTLAVTGEPPPRCDTGDPLFGRAWTLLGLPCICFPAGLGPSGLPIGLQLVGLRGGDRDLLRVAAWVVRQLSRTGVARA
jgi:amidase